MAETEAILFNKTGAAIGDVVATFNRQWTKNGYGEAKFTLAISEVQRRPADFEKGNYLLLRQTDLPDWAGYLDTPEPWGGGKVTFTAYSAERLFELRPGRVDTLYGTGGSIFERMIQMANSWGDTLMRPGNIFKGGATREESFSPANSLYGDVQRVANRSQNDWDVTPQYRTGKLTLLGNWYKSKRQVVDYALAEGVNMQARDGTLEYEGPIWNYVVAFGNAATWTSRVTKEVSDAASIRENGLRVTGLAVDSNEEATIADAADAYLAFYKQPRRKLDVTATNFNNTFRWLRIGNVPDVSIVKYGVENGEMGFSAPMEILEMTYKHGEHAMDLVIKE